MGTTDNSSSIPRFPARPEYPRERLDDVPPMAHQVSPTTRVSRPNGAESRLTLRGVGPHAGFFLTSGDFSPGSLFLLFYFWVDARNMCALKSASDCCMKVRPPQCAMLPVTKSIEGIARGKTFAGKNAGRRMGFYYFHNRPPAPQKPVFRKRAKNMPPEIKPVGCPVGPGTGGFLKHRRSGRGGGAGARGGGGS
jgi:hypothetical protein